MLKKPSLMTQSINDDLSAQATPAKVIKKQNKIDDTTDASSTSSNSS